MLDIMDQAANAIEAYNAKLRTTSANIANMSVTGYKRLDVSFQEVFNRVLSTGTGASSFDNIGGTNPYQTGGSAAIASLGVDFSQGDFGDGSHLAAAITGQGLFIVSADGGSTYYYTRNGDFQIDNSGNLVTAGGYQVYGLNDGGNLVPITGLTGNKYTQANLSFSTNGRLYEYTDNTWAAEKSDTGFRIGLTYFNNPGGLEYIDGTSFIATASSGSAASPLAAGAAAGNVTPRKLEQSNVFYIGETIDALEIQRAMSGSMTVVKMVSDTISQFINKIS